MTTTTATPQFDHATKPPLLRRNQLPYSRFMALSPRGRPTTYSRRLRLDRRAIKKEQVKLTTQPFYQAANEKSQQQMMDILARCVEDRRRKRGLHVSCMFLGYGKPMDGGREVLEVVVLYDDVEMDEDGERKEVEVVVIEDDEEEEEEGDIGEEVYRKGTADSLVHVDHHV